MGMAVWELQVHAAPAAHGACFLRGMSEYVMCERAEAGPLWYGAWYGHNIGDDGGQED